MCIVGDALYCSAIVGDPRLVELKNALSEGIGLWLETIGPTSLADLLQLGTPSLLQFLASRKRKQRQ